jgi:RNA-directed DNA polymerase
MASISLQDLRRRLYVKAKADTQWRFWGLYVHVARLETLRAAYDLAKQKDGAPGIDGVTFEAIEAAGLETFLAKLRDELVARTYRPLRNRRVAIPKDGGKVRVLGIPAIRDWGVQGALKLILEPIFEADFHDGSYGYRPKRKAHDAVERVRTAIREGKAQVIDLDLTAYFDTVRHDLLLGKVACRVQDDEILHLLKLMLKASGRRGVPQGGVISPLLSNIYLNEVDAMLERAKAVTRDGKATYVEYARDADDLVVLVNGHWRNAWLLRAVDRATAGGVRQARSPTERGEEPSRGSHEGGGVRIPGLHHPPGSVSAGHLVGQGDAGREAADGVAAEAQGGVPAPGLPAGGAGDRGDQPDPARLGELLPGGERGTVLQLREGLGREEGAAPSDEGEEPTRLRLETVE